MILDMRFWIIYILVQISFFGGLRSGVLVSVFFFNFSTSASHGGRHFDSTSPHHHHHHHKKASYGPVLTNNIKRLIYKSV